MAAEIPDGAVIVARAILNSSLWTMRPTDRIVALTCMAIANKRPRKWFDGEKEILIERGQFVRSRREMAKACQLPDQVVRTSLVHLEENQFLTRKPTQWYTIYTIPKYSHYQDLTKYSDSAVEKSTQLLTQHQPNQTKKTNPGFPQSFHNGNERNHTEDQSVTKSDGSCADFGPKNQPNKIGKTNPKQQQHIRTTSSDTLIGGGRGDGGTGGGDVVVAPNRWPDALLGKSNFRISTTLLEGIQMKKSVANAFAMEKPLGLVLRVVQQARHQRNPGGWAKIALENDWWLPEASGDELREVIELVKRQVESANAFMLSGAGIVSQKLPRLPGESESDWLRRNMNHLKAKGRKAKTR